jgi:uncharacterized protein YjgD (DUF1641 family)
VSTLTVGNNVESQLGTIAAQLARIEAQVRRQAAVQDMITDLLADASPIVRQLMDTATERLTDVDVAAYREFASGTAGVLDRVMTAFGPDDLDALGDNVVLILETVKEMTQPEIMTMLRRTAHLVGEHPDEPAEPPSVLALARELRDPEVRRGLARVLAMLRSVGDDGTGTTNDEEVAR